MNTAPSRGPPADPWQTSARTTSNGLRGRSWCCLGFVCSLAGFRRILRVAAGEAKGDKVVLFVNFFDELRRLAPTK